MTPHPAHYTDTINKPFHLNYDIHISFANAISFSKINFLSNRLVRFLCPFCNFKHTRRFKPEITLPNKNNIKDIYNYIYRKMSNGNVYKRNIIAFSPIK